MSVICSSLRPKEGLTVTLLCDPGGLLPRRHIEQAIGIHLEGHLDARGTGHHGRNTAQFEARQRTRVSHQLALTLHNMHGQRCLAILEGGKFLGTG